MKALILAAMCLGWACMFVGQARGEDARVSVESSPSSLAPIEQRVSVEPVSLGSLHCGALTEGESGVLVMSFTNLSKAPLAVKLSTAVAEEPARVSFSAESTVPLVLYAPLVVEWLEGDVLIREQRVPMADVALAPGKSARFALGVTVPEKAGTYSVRLTINNWNVLRDDASDVSIYSPQTHLEWSQTLANVAVSASPRPSAFTYTPESGYVPDEATAVSIAKAVWYPIYGKDKIDSEKPFVAKLRNGVWTVEGSLPQEMFGGVAEIDISRENGKVLRVSHGK